MKFLCIDIDIHLNFEPHISGICKNAAGQLNALSQLTSFLNKDQRNVTAFSFILATLTSAN